MNDEFAFVAFETDLDGHGGGLRVVQLERVGVDPMVIPEPQTGVGGLVALVTIGVLLRQRKAHR